MNNFRQVPWLYLVTPARWLVTQVTCTRLCWRESHEKMTWGRKVSRQRLQLLLFTDLLLVCKKKRYGLDSHRLFYYYLHYLECHLRFLKGNCNKELKMSTNYVRQFIFFSPPISHLGPAFTNCTRLIPDLNLPLGTLSYNK